MNILFLFLASILASLSASTDSDSDSIHEMYAEDNISFDNLPNEILFLVCEELDIYTILDWTRVSRYFWSELQYFRSLVSECIEKGLCAFIDSERRLFLTKRQPDVDIFIHSVHISLHSSRSTFWYAEVLPEVSVTFEGLLEIERIRSTAELKMDTTLLLQNFDENSLLDRFSEIESAFWQVTTVILCELNDAQIQFVQDSLSEVDKKNVRSVLLRGIQREDWIYDTFPGLSITYDSLYDLKAFAQNIRNTGQTLLGNPWLFFGFGSCLPQRDE